MTRSSFHKEFTRTRDDILKALAKVSPDEIPASVLSLAKEQLSRIKRGDVLCKLSMHGHIVPEQGASHSYQQVEVQVYEADCDEPEKA